jgi:hypothetical protein
MALFYGSGKEINEPTEAAIGDIISGNGENQLPRNTLPAIYYIFFIPYIKNNTQLIIPSLIFLFPI